MEDEFCENVFNLYKENRWSDILEIGANTNSKLSRKLLWVWPSEKNLDFLKNIVDEFEVQGITSIGCGCGLLEWILGQALDLPVTGIEVNEEWWQSRYSITPFIRLKFPEEPLTEDLLDPNHALLFCYFNNEQASKDYIRVYNGNVIIIIGPGENTYRYTNPTPFKPNLDLSEWGLHEFQEVRNSGDYIAVYVRTKLKDTHD